jgi:hypothetical protein
MKLHGFAAASAGVVLTSMVASAGIVNFSFTPSSGGGTLTSIAGAGGPDIGLMVFDQNSTLNFSIDATGEGLGVINFPSARMTLSLTLPPATNLGGGLFRSNVSGTFTIYDFAGNVRTDILTGNVSGGQFLKFGTSHVILLNSGSGLTYTAGPRLSSILGPGRTLAATQEASFALSSVRTATGSPEIIGPNNVFETFFASTAFTGSTNVVPSPGALVLLGVGSCVIARRRRG